MEGGYQILNLSRWNLTSTSTKIKGAYGFVENNTEHKTVLLEDLMLEGKRYDAIFTTFAKAADNYVGNFVLNDRIYTIIVRPNDNINIRKLEPASDTELNTVDQNSKSRDFELERFGYVCPIINGVRNFVDSDGVLHRRIARVDLGSLDWTYDSGKSWFKTTNVGVISATKNSGNYKSSKYVGVDNSSIVESTDKTVLYSTWYSATGNIIIHDSAYSDASTFKSAMSGVYLYYELSTEETYSAYDTPSVQSMISDDWIGGNHIYEIGDYCIDNNTLYRCKIRHSDGRPSGTDGYIYWDKCKISDLLGYKVATYSGTTNANGNLVIPTSVVPYSSVVIRAIEANSYCPLVYRDDSAWIVHVVSSAASLPVASNRSVSLTIYYL